MNIVSRLSKLGLVKHFSLKASVNQKKTHYDCLGITPKATQGDVKSAYYKLSKECHPDLNRGNPAASEKFKDITAAYEVLGNLNSRKLYDRGLLVGSHAETTDPLRPEEPKYRHSAFYHHRNKPANRKTTSGKTIEFNMDEWTRAHYSNTLSNSHEKKTHDSRLKRDDEQTVKENIGLLQVMTIMALALSYVLWYSVENNYDKPTKSKQDEQPD